MKQSTSKCSKLQKSKMKTEIQKTDEKIKTGVLAELKFDPSVKVTDIGDFPLLESPRWTTNSR